MSWIDDNYDLIMEGLAYETERVTELSDFGLVEEVKLTLRVIKKNGREDEYSRLANNIVDYYNRKSKLSPKQRRCLEKFAINN